MPKSTDPKRYCWDCKRHGKDRLSLKDGFGRYTGRCQACTVKLSLETMDAGRAKP